MTSKVEAVAEAVRALGNSSNPARQSIATVASDVGKLAQRAPKGSTPSARAVLEALNAAEKAARRAYGELSEFAASADQFADRLAGGGSGSGGGHGTGNGSGRRKPSAADIAAARKSVALAAAKAVGVTVAKELLPDLIGKLVGGPVGGVLDDDVFTGDTVKGIAEQLANPVLSADVRQRVTSAVSAVRRLFDGH
ncbi:MAG: hypothetical protein IPH27_11410 [Actinomycetales bacterium]|jgi:hypothetical protein|nr:hypothetical protein [Candidatus Phosphoribacter baldrii]